MHEVSMQDELISPFPSEENEFYYFTMQGSIDSVNSESFSEEFENELRTGKQELRKAVSFVIHVQMANELSTEQRIRYTCWDLLGDVGGFNDGLIFIFQGVMGAYSALLFSIDYADGRYINDSPKKPPKSKSVASNNRKIN